MKNIFTILMIIYGLNAAAQNSIPNGNFENWNSVTFDMLQYYQTSSSDAASSNLPANCLKSTDAYHGSYAVRLTTVAGNGDTLMGYLVNGNPNGNIAQWQGGIPYNQRPTGLRGYYKSSIPAGDTAVVLASFSKSGVNIGYYITKLYGNHSSYTPFSITFNPALTITPDSVIFAATSSNVDVTTGNNTVQIVGSTLLLDSISYTGVVSQPALMNGDFESWQSQTFSALQDWNTSNNNNSVIRTTERVDGDYALELITTLGEDYGQPKASTSYATSGQFNSVCFSMGYPFSNITDTVAFYYKYAPANGTDNANLYFGFKQNTFCIDGFEINLGAAPSYQYYERPFTLNGYPDTVIVQILSSRWEDTLVASVGDDLKIDMLHFKSQPLTGIFNPAVKPNKLIVYPNPVVRGEDLIIQLSPDLTHARAEIYNALGEKIYSEAVEKNQVVVSTRDFATGMYLIKVADGEKVYTNKFILE